MKKFIILIASLFVIAASANAQKYYNTALGIQGGSPSGIRVKHYLSDATSVEAVVGWSLGNSFRVQAHYEFNYSFFGVENMNWYWGLGAFTGFYDNGNSSEKTGFWLGVGGIAGIEYTLPSVPITFHVAGTPGLSIIPNTDFDIGGAIGVHYAFK